MTLSDAGDAGVVAALLYARPDVLACHGAAPPKAEEDRLRGLRGSTDLRFEEGVPWGSAGPTGLLVIDARRDAERLGEELRGRGAGAGVIAVIGTSIAADGGEVDRAAAVAGFVAEGAFRAAEVLEQGAGLSVLVRRGEGASRPEEGRP